MANFLHWQSCGAVVRRCSDATRAVAKFCTTSSNTPRWLSSSPTRIVRENRLDYSIDVAVGTTWRPIPVEEARLARTGEPKIYDYTIYAKQLSGPPGAIRKVEFFPDIVDNTYWPQSYVQTGAEVENRVFSTRHDCWEGSVALLKLTLQDGSVKKLRKRIRFTADFLNESQHTLLCRSDARISNAFGVELELVTTENFRPGQVRDVIRQATGDECLVPGYNTKTMKAWKVETDNSITIDEGEGGSHGVEVVSPILRGKKGLTKLCHMVSALSQYEASTHKSCGFHVHVDLTGIKFPQLKKICMNWVKYEEAIDFALPLDRRDDNNQYCLSVRNNISFEDKTNDQVMDMIDQQTTVKDLVNLMNAHPFNRSRYHKLNLTNLVHEHNPKNTIEFRGFGATLDSNQIEHWVRFLHLFVQASITKGKPQPFEDDLPKHTVFARLFAGHLWDAELRQYFYRLRFSRPFAF